MSEKHSHDKNQKNKPFKSSKNKNTHVTASDDIFARPAKRGNTPNKSEPNSDFVRPRNSPGQDRLQQKLLLRRQKLNEVLFKKRGFIDADSNKSVVELSNLSATVANITALEDTSFVAIPPKNVVIVKLNEEADTDSLYNDINQIIRENLTNKVTNPIYNTNNFSFSAVLPPNIAKGKDRITLINTPREKYAIIDSCKAADLIIFVSSLTAANAAEIKMDPYNNGRAIDDFGYSVIQLLRAQGMPKHLGVIQHSDKVVKKQETLLKNLYTRFFDSELFPEKTFSLVTADDLTKMLRYLANISTFDHPLGFRKHRSYLLSQEVNYQADTGALFIDGYLRGNTLASNSYLHITGFGDFKASLVEMINDPCPKKDYKLKTLAETDVDLARIVGDNKEETIFMTGQSTTPVILTNTGEFKVNNDNKLIDKLIDKEIFAFDNLQVEQDDEVSIDLAEAELIVEQEKNSRKRQQKTEVDYRTVDEMDFPDEVDTPLDQVARERFAKYRGVPSMKRGSWNIYEDLPEEYGKIFSFENYIGLKKQVIKRAHEEGQKISGCYVRIVVENFPADLVTAIRNDRPLIVSTLLEHERKICLMHYKVHINFESQSTLHNKDVLEMHVAFRRMLVKPIVSDDSHTKNTDKLIMHKHPCEKDKTYLLSAYSPLSYNGTPCLYFKHRGDYLDLIATGEAQSADTDKIILKKIVLTGYPFKVKKRKAVVRFMFFNKEDIHYFQPIELSTKNGMRGRILDSLGTHGYMKCLFSDNISNADIVCMNLFKRVYPKWFPETFYYSVLYGDQKGYKSFFEDNEEMQE